MFFYQSISPNSWKLNQKYNAGITKSLLIYLVVLNSTNSMKTEHEYRAAVNKKLITPYELKLATIHPDLDRSISANWKSISFKLGND